VLVLRARQVILTRLSATSEESVLKGNCLTLNLKPLELARVCVCVCVCCTPSLSLFCWRSRAARCCFPYLLVHANAPYRLAHGRRRRSAPRSHGAHGRRTASRPTAPPCRRLHRRPTRRRHVEGTNAPSDLAPSKFFNILSVQIFPFLKLLFSHKCEVTEVNPRRVSEFG